MAVVVWMMSCLRNAERKLEFSEQQNVPRGIFFNIRAFVGNVRSRFVTFDRNVGYNR